MAPDSLANIYDLYNHALFIYAVRLLGDSDQAEDCVAETFSRLLKALRAGQGPRDHLQAYLYRVAHNWITDHFRRHPLPPLDLHENIQSDPALSPANQVEKRLVEEKVRKALTHLTPDQRHVVVLRFFEGWALDEVSVSMDKPVGAIKALQHRAMEALKVLLPEYTPDGFIL